jgi:hypothetical protein
MRNSEGAMRNLAVSFLIFTFFLANSSAFALSIGTAPGVLNIGEIEPGKNFKVDFYLLTNSDRDVLVSLNYIKAHKSLLQQNHTGRWTLIPANTSEEDTTDWIEFVENPIMVSPYETIVVSFPGGMTIKANKRASMIIHVPEDVEPGYHMFSINPNPLIGAGGRGGTITTIGLTRTLAVFRIPGKAVRNGAIEGLAAGRASTGAAKIDVLFRNTGTVTIEATAKPVKVYDEFGEYVKSINSPAIAVPPGEVAVLTSIWDDNRDMEQKNHRVEATVEYTTGRVTTEAMVAVPPYKVAETPMVIIPEKELPWWLLILLVGLLMIYIYWKYY